MNVRLSAQEKVSALVQLAEVSGIAIDKVLALYLVLKDDIFFLFDLFQGETVKFPSLRLLRKAITRSDSYTVQKLVRSSYVVNGREERVEDIRKGDVVRISGKEVIALGVPQEILGKIYILCKENKDGAGKE